MRCFVVKFEVKMKKLLLIVMLLVWPLALLAQGSLYKQYASRPGLTVAQVDGFKLCDSVRVDVVLLQADDEAAWRRLAVEFGVEGEEGVVSWLADTERPAKRVGWTGRPVLRAVASHARRTLAFYRLDNERQYDALLDYQLYRMKGDKKNKK